MDVFATLVALLAILSLYFTTSLVSFGLDLRQVVRSRSLTRLSPYDPISDSSYSYVGGDYPRRLPLTKSLQPIAMTVEESAHYAFMGEEAPMEYLWTAPIGDNHVRLGPDHRFFAVAMFHQIHCLRGFRDAMEGKLPHGHHFEGHLHHCLNYVRQWSLCSADTTLEPGDFTKRNFTIERTGATHTCLDWEPIYEDVADRWHEWSQYQKEHDIFAS